MNLIDAYVVKILSEPKLLSEISGYWVEVEYEDDGGTGFTNLYFETLDEALNLKVGYEFLH